MKSAHEHLRQAGEEMQKRSQLYGCQGGERSMAKTVAIFEAITGIKLTEEQGNKFMISLKLARSENRAYNGDNYVDGCAYFALAGEEAFNADMRKKSRKAAQAPTTKVSDNANSCANEPYD